MSYVELLSQAWSKNVLSLLKCSLNLSGSFYTSTLSDEGSARAMYLMVGPDGCLLADQ
jgi:hypothetical protein